MSEVRCMFTLNVKLMNAVDVSDFKEKLLKYDNKVSTVIGGHVVARPMITSSPYITPLDDITINFYSDSINEFMQMIRDLLKYVTDTQDYRTSAVIKGMS